MNSSLTVFNVRKPKLKELSKEELENLYIDDYIKITRKYIYYPSALNNNHIFDLDYVEEEKFKITKKTN